MPARIFLSGCNGRMGRTIRSMVAESADLHIVAGSDLQTDPTCPFPVYQDPEQCSEAFDVLIDFSTPDALAALSRLISARHCPAVICTTGLNAEQQSLLNQLSASAAIFVSANMSLGINLLVKLARQAAALLYPDFDIEIIEAHHNQKIDAPSGTALMIAEQINKELDHRLSFVTDRSSVRRKRSNKELGLHAIRGGTIVGDHTVMLAGPEETLQIAHSAQSRAVFARGALAAARFLVGKPAGRYSMDDILKIKLET